MENSHICKIVINANFGATLEQAIVDAFAISYKSCCDVQVIHNGRNYIVRKIDIDSFLNGVETISEKTAFPIEKG